MVIVDLHIILGAEPCVERGQRPSSPTRRLHQQNKIFFKALKWKKPKKRVQSDRVADEVAKSALDMFEAVEIPKL